MHFSPSCACVSFIFIISHSDRFALTRKNDCVVLNPTSHEILAGSQEIWAFQTQDFVKPGDATGAMEGHLRSCTLFWTKTFQPQSREVPFGFFCLILLNLTGWAHVESWGRCLAPIFFILILYSRFSTSPVFVQSQHNFNLVLAQFKSRVSQDLILVRSRFSQSSV